MDKVPASMESKAGGVGVNEITKTRVKVTVVLSSMTAGLVFLSFLLNIMDDVGGKFAP